MVKNSIKDFEKNKENPFLKEALEKVEKKVVKKYKSSSGTSKKAIFQAVDSEGNPVGHTSFIRQVEVDEEEFTKIYLSQFSAFFDLKQNGIRVFGYVMTKLVPNKDMFMFFLDECMEYTGYKSHKSVHSGLAQLLNCGIIARGRSDNFYFINPMVIFNGDRISFTKTYVNKNGNSINEKNVGQMNIIEQIKEKESQNDDL